MATTSDGSPGPPGHHPDPTIPPKLSPTTDDGLHAKQRFFAQARIEMIMDPAQPTDSNVLMKTYNLFQSISEVDKSFSYKGKQGNNKVMSNFPTTKQEFDQAFNWIDTATRNTNRKVIILVETQTDLAPGEIKAKLRPYLSENRIFIYPNKHGYKETARIGWFRDLSPTSTRRESFGTTLSSQIVRDMSAGITKAFQQSLQGTPNATSDLSTHLQVEVLKKTICNGAGANRISTEALEIVTSKLAAKYVQQTLEAMCFDKSIPGIFIPYTMQAKASEEAYRNQIRLQNRFLQTVTVIPIHDCTDTLLTTLPPLVTTPGHPSIPNATAMTKILAVEGVSAIQPTGSDTRYLVTVRRNQASSACAAIQQILDDTHAALPSQDNILQAKIAASPVGRHPKTSPQVPAIPPSSYVQALMDMSAKESPNLLVVTHDVPGQMQNADNNSKQSTSGPTMNYNAPPTRRWKQPPALTFCMVKDQFPPLPSTGKERRGPAVSPTASSTKNPPAGLPPTQQARGTNSQSYSGATATTAGDEIGTAVLKHCHEILPKLIENILTACVEQTVRLTTEFLLRSPISAQQEPSNHQGPGAPTRIEANRDSNLPDFSLNISVDFLQRIQQEIAQNTDASAMMSPDFKGKAVDEEINDDNNSLSFYHAFPTNSSVSDVPPLPCDISMISTPGISDSFDAEILAAEQPKHSQKAMDYDIAEGELKRSRSPDVTTNTNNNPGKSLRPNADNACLLASTTGTRTPPSISTGGCGEDNTGHPTVNTVQDDDTFSDDDPTLLDKLDKMSDAELEYWTSHKDNLHRLYRQQEIEELKGARMASTTIHDTSIGLDKTSQPVEPTDLPRAQLYSDIPGIDTTPIVFCNFEHESVWFHRGKMGNGKHRQAIVIHDDNKYIGKLYLAKSIIATGFDPHTIFKAIVSKYNLRSKPYPTSYDEPKENLATTDRPSDIRTYFPTVAS